MESDPTNRWFVCPHPNPQAGTRLFLFPYAGGGPASFGKWPAGLPDTIETWIVHYPGRGSRYNETPLNRIASLSQKLSQAIGPLLDRPFTFFGHSMGALIAFELAKLLQRQSLPQPRILFISACGAPSDPAPLPLLHTLPDPQFIQALKKLNGIPSEVMNVPELIELLLPALRADIEAVESYVYTSDMPLTSPIFAFGGLDDPRVSRERLEGWASHTGSGFKSRYFPGGHFFINVFQKEILQSIASEVILLVKSKHKTA